MKTQVILAVIGMYTAAASAQPSAGSAAPVVTVCLERGNNDTVSLVRARILASRMFGAAGVQIDWRRKTRSCPSEAIQVALGKSAAPEDHPLALAYALPYEGTTIVLFHDRLLNHEQLQRPCVIAHVLVHEITHMLQGVARHSSEGVMKAHWEKGSYCGVGMKPLPFTMEDVDLIQRGMRDRAARLQASRE